MICKGCVKGFVFPADGELVGTLPKVPPSTGNGYFCLTCGRPLVGNQRKHCSTRCTNKFHRSKGRSHRPGNEEVGHGKR